MPSQAEFYLVNKLPNFIKVLQCPRHFKLALTVARNQNWSDTTTTVEVKNSFGTNTHYELSSFIHYTLKRNKSKLCVHLGEMRIISLSVVNVDIYGAHNAM